MPGTFWTGQTGDWTNAADWSAGVPTSSTDAYFDAAGTYTVTLSTAQSAAGVYIYNQETTFDETSSGSLTVAGDFVDDGHSLQLLGNNTISGYLVTKNTTELFGDNSIGGGVQVSGTLYIEGSNALGAAMLTMAPYSFLGSMTDATVGNAVDIQGSVGFSGSGSTLAIGAGGWTIGSSIRITTQGNVVLFGGAADSVGTGFVLQIDGGTLTAGDSHLGNLLGSGTLELTSATFDTAGFSASIENLNTDGGTLADSGTAATLRIGNGVLNDTAISGPLTLDITGSLSDITTGSGGTIDLQYGSFTTLQSSTSASGGPNVQFNAPSTLAIYANAGATDPVGTISDFTAGDLIDLQLSDIASASQLSLSYNAGTGVLEILEGGSTVEASLSFSGSYSPKNFVLSEIQAGSVADLTIRYKATTNWKGNPGNWDTGANWTDGVPLAIDEANIKAAGTYTVSLGDSETAYSLLVDSTNATLQETSTGNLTMSGALAIDAGTVELSGTNAFAGITLDGGTLDVGSASALGNIPLRLERGVLLSEVNATISNPITESSKLALTIGAANATTLAIGGISLGAIHVGTAAYDGTVVATGGLGSQTYVDDGTLDLNSQALSKLTVNQNGTVDLAGKAASLSSLSGSGGLADSGGAATLTIGSGSFSGEISGPITIEIYRGDLVLDATGSAAEIVVDQGGELQLFGAASSNIVFEKGTVEFYNTNEYTGTLSNFVHSDKILVQDVDYVSGMTPTYNSTTGVLTITDGTNTANLDFAPASNVTAATFILSSDSEGGVEITSTLDHLDSVPAVHVSEIEPPHVSIPETVSTTSSAHETALSLLQQEFATLFHAAHSDLIAW